MSVRPEDVGLSSERLARSAHIFLKSANAFRALKGLRLCVSV